MRIVCPQCGYSRDVPEDRVPAGSSIATCPKCRFRFRFRGYQTSQGLPVEEPAYPPRPSRPAPVEPVMFEEPGPARPAPRPGRTAAAQEASAHPAARWRPDEEPVGEDRNARREGAAPAADPVASPDRPALRWSADMEPAEPRRARPRPAARWLPDPEPASAEPEEPGPAPAPEPAADPWSRLGAERSDPHAVPEANPWMAPVPEPEPVGPAPTRSEEPRPEELSPEAHAQEHSAEDPPPPSEATVGQESVRDIWARLQAMAGDDPGQARADQTQGSEQARSASGQWSQVAPWEYLEHIGVVPALLVTLKNILLSPGDFFDGLPEPAGRLKPLAFAMTICEVVLAFLLVWNFFGVSLGFMDFGRTELIFGLGTGAVGRLAWLVLAPPALAGFLFLDAALAYLLLGLLRGATRGFDETLRVLCYAGAPWILAVLPIPQTYLIPVVLIWNMTMQAIGLKKLHQSGYAQVLAAVLVKWSLFIMGFFTLLHFFVMQR